MIRWMIVLSAALMLWGCGYDVYYTPLNNPVTPAGEAIAEGVVARGPISPDEVTLFLVQRPEKRYRELGIITIPTFQSIPDQQALFQLYRAKAAEIGADGVIMMEPQTTLDTYTSPTYVADWGIIYQDTVRSRSIFRGMAIQFLE
ncbi:hypothetical protein [Cerasicoccus maritimus]|uniref:hypothetical protein n=1 Tax=Cerasicoccus maritimus TaxID=490089 RepID=UPI002852A15B|nr:hypothetical protein [Cerasicoccus maritimus]